VLRIARGYKSADRKIKAGGDLLRLGDSGGALYCLASGWATLYNLLGDGRRQILQFVLPGAILAFLPAPGAAVNYGVQALTDAVVSIVPRASLTRLSRDHPEFGMQLAGLIARDRSLAYDRLASIGRRSARERVAHLLLELFIRFRMRWPGQHGEQLQLPLSQEHIGDATGLTGVHVNRVLQDLRKNGIVEFHYRRLHILNPDRLVEAAGVTPEVALSWIDGAMPREADALPEAMGDPPAVRCIDASRRSRL
jgi:CRP/FNR family transcriptional regulator